MKNFIYACVYVHVYTHVYMYACMYKRKEWSSYDGFPRIGGQEDHFMSYNSATDIINVDHHV